MISQIYLTYREAFKHYPQAKRGCNNVATQEVVPSCSSLPKEYVLCVPANLPEATKPVYPPPWEQMQRLLVISLSLQPTPLQPQMDSG